MVLQHLYNDNWFHSAIQIGLKKQLFNKCNAYKNTYKNFWGFTIVFFEISGCLQKPYQNTRDNVFSAHIQWSSPMGMRYQIK